MQSAPSAASGALPRIPDMPAETTVGAGAAVSSSGGANPGNADAASASVAATSTAATPAIASAAALSPSSSFSTPAVSSSSTAGAPLHLIPPQDLRQMLDLQNKALASLRASNARFVTFAEYASRSYDSLSSLHATRVGRVRALRDALMDIFVRVRHLRMRLHERAPGANAYREDEEQEAAEVEQLKLDLLEEERQAAELLKQQQQLQQQEGGDTTVDALTGASSEMSVAMAALSLAHHQQQRPQRGRDGRGRGVHDEEHDEDNGSGDGSEDTVQRLLDENLAAAHSTAGGFGLADEEESDADVLATDRRAAEPLTDPSLAL
jgi:hypothetical protein